MKISCLVTLFLVHVVTSTAVPPPTIESTDTGAYIVVFESEPGSSAAKAEHQAFLAQAQQLGIQLHKRMEFTTLINGMSVDVNGQHTQRLSTIKGVKSVVPMHAADKPRMITADVGNPALRFTHSITGVNAVHDTFKLSGKGIKVGIIDSGIDYTHPALGGCFGKGCKVAYGWNFVNNTGDPMDCYGHGTHVAGIVASSDDVNKGVAKDVVLGGYKVIGCRGEASMEHVIAAIERAYADGMDVVNMSLGFASDWANHPVAMAADKLAEKGVVVVASIGNEGVFKGAFSARSPSIGNKVLSVASFDNTRYMGHGFTVDGTTENFDAIPEANRPAPVFEHAEVVHVKFPDNLNCDAIRIDGDVKGKIALMSPTNCGLLKPVMAAQTAGAIVAMFHNDEFGADPPFFNSTDISISTVGVTQKTGWRLMELLEKSSVKITFPKEEIALDNPTGGRASLFSSWGPGSELELKPDLGAPGGLIHSTYLNKGWKTMSGTSMAAPYVAGAVALYLQAKGKRNPSEIMDVFRLTAQPTVELNTNDLASAFRQGSGMIQVKDAILSTTHITPTKLTLLSSDFKRGKLKSITITNTGKYAMRYFITHKPALAVSAWSADGKMTRSTALHQSSMQVDIDTKQVTLQPGQSAKINMFFKPPLNADISKRWIYSGYVVVTPKSTAEDIAKGFTARVPAMSVPYGGMYGNYKRILVISSGYPKLNVESAESSWIRMPTISFSLDISARMVRLCLTDAKGQVLGLLADGEREYLGSGNDVITYWRGNYIVNKEEKFITPGTYKIKAEALGPFSNKGNAHEWDTKYSDEFTVDESASKWKDAPSKPDDIKGRFFEQITPEESKKADDSVLPQRLVFPPHKWDVLWLGYSTLMVCFLIINILPVQQENIIELSQSPS